MTAGVSMAKIKLLVRCIPLFAIGCASTDRIDPVPAPRTESPGSILVTPQSHVCVSVYVDQRIWPRRLNAEVFRALSGNLMVQLRRMYAQRGGTIHIPDTHNEPRFRSYPYGPNCRDDGTDVFVDMHYGPRADGELFIMRYWLRRGGVVRFGTADVNVPDEIRAGRMPAYWERRTEEAVIGEDIVRRAPVIANQLTTM